MSVVTPFPTLVYIFDRESLKTHFKALGRLSELLESPELVSGLDRERFVHIWLPLAESTVYIKSISGPKKLIQLVFNLKPKNLLVGK